MTPLRVAGKWVFISCQCSPSRKDTRSDLPQTSQAWPPPLQVLQCRQIWFWGTGTCLGSQPRGASGRTRCRCTAPGSWPGSGGEGSSRRQTADLTRTTWTDAANGKCGAATCNLTGQHDRDTNCRLLFCTAYQSMMNLNDLNESVSE